MPAPKHKRINNLVESLGKSGKTAAKVKPRAAKQIEQNLTFEKMQEDALSHGLPIAEIDTARIESSSIGDRLSDGGEAFDALISSIKTQGQLSPILVRPHPNKQHSYMVVFGHRRLRACKQLNIKVKAVIRNDITNEIHATLQGQENTIRDDLSFLEKANFATNMEKMGISREVIIDALNSDKSNISRMISVANELPSEVINAFGSAKGIKRDAWYNLKKQIAPPVMTMKALDIIKCTDFLAQDDPTEKMKFLQSALKKRSTKKTNKTDPQTKKIQWQRGQDKISASVKLEDKKASISINSQQASEFTDYLAKRLECLYDEFCNNQK